MNMSLTDFDLQDMRVIVREETEAIESNIKEIYHILAKMNRDMITDTNFQKLSVEKKLIVLNVELLAAAKQAGIQLRNSL